MNYKKLTSLLIIPALFCQTTVFAAKLSIDEINISLDTVTVHGTLDGTGNADILMYVAQASDEAGAEDVNLSLIHI